MNPRSLSERVPPPPLLVWLGVAVLTMAAPSLWALHITTPGVDMTRTALEGEGYLRFAPDPGSRRTGDEWSGWIDVRHPALNGPRDVDCSYDTASGCAFDRSDRSLQVQSIILRDNTGAIAPDDRINDFHYADKAYLLQAGVSVLEAGVRGVDSPAAGRPGSFDFPLSHGLGDAQMGLPQEEQTIMGNHNSGAPLIDNYYATSLTSGALAETFHPSFFPGAGNEAIFMGNIRAGGTPPVNRGNDAFAHELYHFVGDGQAIHSLTPGDPAHSQDPGNIVTPFTTRPGSINEAGPRLSATVGGKMQITSSQVQQIFTDPQTRPFFPGGQRGNVDAAGNKVDWDFVADHPQRAVDHDGNAATAAVAFGLEGLGGGADHSQGADPLFWTTGAGAAPRHPPAGPGNTGHDHSGLGQFGNLQTFPGQWFNVVDVFSLATRYSDSDVNAAGNKDLRHMALDYDLMFQDMDGNQQRVNQPKQVFNPGWTDATPVDDHLGRWVLPTPATGVFINAHALGDHGHDGVTQIDALVAAVVEDLGDAPDSYRTLRDSDGPRYEEGFLQRLGQHWDYDMDGQPSIRADGDDRDINLLDFDLGDDEDGVFFGPDFVDVLFDITRPGSNPYQLRAWWDVNESGFFDHPFELFIDAILDLTPGLHSRRFGLPFDPRAFYSRFRLTWDPMDLDVLPFGKFVSVDGIAHGEVEDYAPIPLPATLTLLAGGLLGLNLVRGRKAPGPG